MIERRENKPDGWIWKGIQFKDGWELCSNGKSIFSKEYKHLICKRRDWTKDINGNWHSTEHVSKGTDDTSFVG